MRRKLLYSCLQGHLFGAKKLMSGIYFHLKFYFYCLYICWTGLINCTNEIVFIFDLQRFVPSYNYSIINNLNSYKLFLFLFLIYLLDWINKLFKRWGLLYSQTSIIYYSFIFIFLFLKYICCTESLRICYKNSFNLICIKKIISYNLISNI